MIKIKQPHWGAIIRLEKGETANPNGRPRKWIALVNHELTQAGYTPATKQDIEANYMSLLQLSEKELKDMVAKQEKPMIVRIIAKAMLSGKGFDIIEKMLDRGIGKAKQTEEIHQTTTITTLTTDEQEAIRTALRAQGLAE